MPLKLLGDVLGDILKDSAKKRLKPKTSAEVAKRKAFHLFDALNEAEAASSRFCAALRQLSASPDERPRWELSQLASEVIHAARRLGSPAEEVAPQLRLHERHAWGQIIHYTIARGRLADGFWSILSDVRNFDVDTLATLANEAENNQKLINEVTERVRTLFAKEFPFKESF